MERHTRVYMKFFSYGMDDFVPCEICFMGKKDVRAADVHHICGRGKGMDVIENLMALCRRHHDNCHFVTPLLEKEYLLGIHQQFIEKFYKNNRQIILNDEL